ncbi:18343_t:CDS:2, partial [Acaulospora morrowiae]
MDACSLPPFYQFSPRKLAEFSPDSSFAHTRGLSSPSIVEHSNEKREHLPPLNSILHSTLSELQGARVSPPISIPKLQHAPMNHASATSSTQYHERVQAHNDDHCANSSYPSISQELENNSQSPNDDNIKHRPIPSQPNVHSLSLSQSSHPPIWSRAGSPNLLIEQIQPYQRSLPSHPYEINDSIQHANIAPGYHYRNLDNVTSSHVQVAEQSLEKMSKVIDCCNRISQPMSQCRNARTLLNSWLTTPQVSEAQLTDMISLAHEVLDILNGLKGELISKNSTESILNNDDFDFARKTRTQRMKYRKRSKRAAPPGRCHSCNISETPEWRRGPDGARTLCNACGL